MAKLRLSLLLIAMTAAVSLALTTRQNPLCEDFPQFFKSGSTYLPAGEYGVDYFCWNSAGICTYYQPDPFGPFVACRTGRYQQIFNVNKVQPSNNQH